jgi:hypothetical protein
MKTSERKPFAELPPAGEAVWAECADIWILAYVDENGIWRAAADGQPLKAPTQGIHTWLPRHYHRPLFVYCHAPSPSFLSSFAV